MPLVLGHVMDGDNCCPISEVPSFGCAFLAVKKKNWRLMKGGTLRERCPVNDFEKRCLEVKSPTLLAIINYHCFAQGQTCLDIQ